MFAQKRAKLTAAEYVNMQVIYGLTAVTVAVYLQSITLVSNPMCFGRLVRYAHKMAYQRLLPRRYVANGGYVLIRNDKKMNGCLRVDVPYDKSPISFVKEITLNFT